MEQVNSMMDAVMQAVILASNPAQSAKGKGSGDDFRKLMDRASSDTGKDTGTDAPQAAGTGNAAAANNSQTTAQKESSLSQIKKMLEQNGAFAYMPGWPCIQIDMQTGETVASYEPGEWVMVYTGEEIQAVPIVDLEGWQQAQLRQLLIAPHPIDVSDPRADAILEATAPGADNSPAAMLEKTVADQFGRVVEQTAEKSGPETRGFDGEQEIAGDEMKLLDAEQAPQKLFHDVKAAPIKVGDVYQSEQPENADVSQQLDSRLAQALEKGESTVRVELKPEYLGTVTVEISRSAEGILKVALSAHSIETRGLLERHASALQGLLGSRTNQTVEVEVQRQSEAQQGQNQQNYDGHNGRDHSGQEHQRRRHDEHHSRDFAQQLRLGLIPMDAEAV